MLTLRLGQGIVLLQMQGQAPRGVLDQSVAVVVPALDLYPTGL